jgi:oxygen-independent coproporphyrinogen-3 oxidase
MHHAQTMAGLYIHIPFCRRRCNYCDFYFVTNSALMADFLAALTKELTARASLLDGHVIETLYFGGGTPSMLSPKELSSILNLIFRTYTVAPNLEFTLEVNPEDVDAQYFSALKDLGVNRISLGIQSFCDAKLRWLSREHTAAQSRHALELAQTYFSNVSVDLIFGIEGETLTEWEKELETVLAFQPQHISTYALTIEPRTLLEKLIKRGQRQPPLDAVQADMFLCTMHTLRANGYEHYEVSNFSKPNFQSRHNHAYWQRVPYLGFGPSAHSFVTLPHHEERFANQAHLKAYLQSPELALAFREILTPRDIFNEMVLLGLRQQGGLNLSELQKKFCNFAPQFSAHFARCVAKLNSLEADGFVVIETHDAHQIVKLTDKGFTLADAIAESLFL